MPDQRRTVPSGLSVTLRWLAEAAPAMQVRLEHGIDHLGHQRHGADAAGMAAGLVTLRDDDVDPGGLEPARLLDVAA